MSTTTTTTTTTMQKVSKVLLPAIATLQQGPPAVSTMLASIENASSTPPIVRQEIVSGLQAIGNNAALVKALYNAAAVLDRVCPAIAEKSFAGLPKIPAHYCTFAAAGKDLLRSRAQQLGTTEQELASIEQSAVQLPKQLQSLIAQPKKSTIPCWLLALIGVATLALVALLAYAVYRWIKKRNATTQKTTAATTKKADDDEPLLIETPPRQTVGTSYETQIGQSSESDDSILE